MEEIKNTKKQIIEDELFDDNNVPEVIGFFKFREINDRIFGTLKEPSEIQKTSDPNFKDQWIYVLENPQGISGGKPIDKVESIKVGINIDKKITVEKANKASTGQLIGFKYVSDFETEKSKKGKANPFKVIEVYVK